jgi:hypothetical protein
MRSVGSVRTWEEEFKYWGGRRVVLGMRPVVGMYRSARCVVLVERVRRTLPSAVDSEDVIRVLYF